MDSIEKLIIVKCPIHSIIRPLLRCVDFAFVWKKMLCMAFYFGGGYFIMPQQVWGQSDLICTLHWVLEIWAYPYKSQIWKFWNMGVVIPTELYFEILRPMVKELAQYHLPFWSYDQITVIFITFWNIPNKW